MVRGYRPPLPVIERLEMHSALCLQRGCLLFLGARDRCGYGYIMTGSRTDGSRTPKLIHRAIWEELVGPIGDGMEIDHTCFIRNCWNIRHLREIPADENRRIRGPEGQANLHANLVKARAVLAEMRAA